MSKKYLLTRRSFLRVLAAGGLALTACAIAKPNHLKTSLDTGETQMKKYTTNGALLPVRKADDFASGSPQFALQLDDTRRGMVKVLLEEGVENVHECGLVA